MARTVKQRFQSLDTSARLVCFLPRLEFFLCRNPDDVVPLWMFWRDEPAGQKGGPRVASDFERS